MAAVLERRLQDMPGIRQLIQVVMLAAALAIGLWVFFLWQTPSYAPLYGRMSDRDAAEVTEALRAANIPFRLDAAGTVSVPDATLNEARLKLAGQGLPNGSRAGFEMIEGEQGFGVSQFVEGARYQMALETELSRTIATLRPVRDSRVHLAIPKQTAFTRARDKAAASVLLELHPGRALERNQVAAIVHLVSTSVPDLSPERVTVIDQSGRLLSETDPNSDDAVSMRQYEQVQRLQDDYSRRILRLLEPMTGPGRVSAQVSVDMDFTVVEEARESFTPDPTALRTEQTSEQSVTGVSTGGIPGATPNTPPTGDPTQGGGAQVNGTPQSASRTASRNFELDRTISHSRQSVGRVSRVTAAVLVDNIPGGLDDAGNPTMRPVNEDEIARIQTLVREAIGFSADRGDSVSVVNAAFVAPEPLAPLEEPPFYENPMYRDYARIALGFIAVLLVLTMVVRPALRSVMSPAPPPRLARDEDEEDEDDDEDAEDAEHRAARKLAHERQAQLPGVTPQEEAQGILAGPGNYEQRLTVARAAVDQDARRVAQVVRSWVNTDG
ncbi:flagellar basal-body MS-ring/collar protein FliF [Pseudomarimonas arenosa]|uniref:Flagellar M-ring protein n=1 Tax=Pseudomarimonas arenosa TaxID=2774145 RepID=A0AAW3ZJV0_9GAMM|nr:flagellar basal-body MS-ring/collar protein FliF [Pseudomarimonas arenosa]MBD8524741.1 flagellar M-ring protein FliF [Pseudomarimonas arenosa]